MAGLNVTWVGLVTPEVAALALQDIAIRIVRGQTSGTRPDGTVWETDGVDPDADKEDDDDTIPA